MKTIITAYVFAVLSCFADTLAGTVLNLIAIILAIAYAYRCQKRMAE